MCTLGDLRRSCLVIENKVWLPLLANVQGGAHLSGLDNEERILGVEDCSTNLSSQQAEHTMLEARSCTQGAMSPRLSKGPLELPSLPLPASGGTNHSLACGCITPVSSCLYDVFLLCQLLFIFSMSPSSPLLTRDHPQAGISS